MLANTEKCAMGEVRPIAEAFAHLPHAVIFSRSTNSEGLYEFNGYVAGDEVHGYFRITKEGKLANGISTKTGKLDSGHFGKLAEYACDLHRYGGQAIMLSEQGEADSRHDKGNLEIKTGAGRCGMADKRGNIFPHCTKILYFPCVAMQARYDGSIPALADLCGVYCHPLTLSLLIQKYGLYRVSKAKTGGGCSPAIQTFTSGREWHGNKGKAMCAEIHLLQARGKLGKVSDWLNEIQ